MKVVVFGSKVGVSHPGSARIAADASAVARKRRRFGCLFAMRSRRSRPGRGGEDGGLMTLLLREGICRRAESGTDGTDTRVRPGRRPPETGGGNVRRTAAPSLRLRRAAPIIHEAPSTISTLADPSGLRVTFPTFGFARWPPGDKFNGWRNTSPPSRGLRFSRRRHSFGERNPF